MRILLVFIVVAAIASVVPAPASAGLVPCGASENDPDTAVDESVPCSFPCVFRLIHNVFNLVALRLAPLISVTAFIFGAVLIMFSGANQSWHTRGRQVVTGTVVGLLFVLLSWVIVNTTINVLSVNPVAPGQPQGFPWPWNEPKGGCYAGT